MTELFAELETLRRRRDWTYQELADAIAEKTQRRRDQDCWRKLCQGLTERPHSRTVTIAEDFLASLKKARRRVA